MTANTFYPNPDHAGDVNTTVPQTRNGAVPTAHVVHPHPADTLGDITLKAYGANTAALRERILKGNVDLSSGPVRAPHG